LSAQGGFIKPEVLDSASAAIHDSYVSVRDTLRSVSGKSSLLLRDIRSASNAVLFSRARGLEAACSASLRHLDRSRSRMLDSELARRAPAPRRTAMDRALLELRATLATCAEEYKGMNRLDQMGQMKERGASLALKNQIAIRNFEGTAEPYLLSLGIRVRPHGAGANPYAGTSRRP
jgi:hypothetical protein